MIYRAAPLVVALTVGLATRVGAQSSPVPVKEEKPGLLARAKVTPDSARVIALRAVAKGGKIAAAEIEEEGGKLVYSFDIKISRKKGIDEVLVDAMTGKVVGVEHEATAAEAAEAKKDAATKPPVPDRPAGRSGKAAADKLVQVTNRAAEAQAKIEAQPAKR